jgi:hypothetical protein
MSFNDVGEIAIRIERLLDDIKQELDLLEESNPLKKDLLVKIEDCSKSINALLS